MINSLSKQLQQELIYILAQCSNKFVLTTWRNANKFQSKQKQIFNGNITQPRE